MMFDYRELSDHTVIRYSNIQEKEGKEVVTIKFERPSEKGVADTALCDVIFPNGFGSEITLKWCEGNFDRNDIEKFEDIIRKNADCFLSNAKDASLSKEKLEQKLKEYDQKMIKLNEEYYARKYTLDDVIEEAYRIEMNNKSLNKNDIPTSYSEEAKKKFREFCAFMALPTEQLKNKKGFCFTNRNKEFLAWILSEFTVEPIKQIRNGVIGDKEFDVYQKMIHGAENILEDAQISKTEFEEVRKRFHVRIGYYNVLHDVILNKIGRMLEFEGLILYPNDKIVCLNWILNRFLDDVRCVIDEMAEIRRSEIHTLIAESNVEQNSFRTNKEAWIEAQIVVELENSKEYQILIKERQSLESPVGKKGTKNWVKRNKRIGEIDNKIDKMRQQLKDMLSEKAEDWLEESEEDAKSNDDIAKMRQWVKNEIKNTKEYADQSVRIDNNLKQLLKDKLKSSEDVLHEAIYKTQQD